MLQRSDELDGDHYEILTPGAEALASKYPLAATLVLSQGLELPMRPSSQNSVDVSQGRSRRVNSWLESIASCRFGASKASAETPSRTTSRTRANLLITCQNKKTEWAEWAGKSGRFHLRLFPRLI